MSFKFEFTKEKLSHILKKNKEIDEWFDAMEEMLPKYDINTIDRVAGFLAQCAHESLDFTILKENLNYSADALNRVFPKYFERAGRDAQEYHRQPEKIANVIYASRMDNGDTASGDGYRFRGRGVIQLTGRHNYTKFGESIGKSAEEVIPYVETKQGALESACWFWSSNGINRYADAQDIVGMTKRINGGTIGLEDRKHHYSHALEVLGGHYDPSSKEAPLETVRKGSKGDTVMKVQRALGITPVDGDFGPGTERIVKEWQTKNGLVADGIVGPKSLGKLLG
jgi:putative chitinase